MLSILPTEMGVLNDLKFLNALSPGPMREARKQKVIVPVNTNKIPTLK